MFVLLLAGVIPAFYEADGPIERNQLIQLLEACRPEFRDVSFEYEGEYVYPREQQQKAQGLGPDGISENYSGLYVRRGDDARVVDIYRSNQRTKSASHGVVAVRADTVEHFVKADNSPKAKISLRRAKIEEFGRGNFGSIWLRDAVLGYAKSTYLYECEGVRRHDGNDCLVVRFYLAEDETTPKNKLVTNTFWIDLKRGGHILHHEERWGDELAKLTTGIRLESFESEPGKSVWIPVTGHCEGRVTIDPSVRTKQVFLNEPVYVENYRILKTSLRWNQGLKDDRFSVKARPGDAVTDTLRQAKYEHGQYMVRSKSENTKPVSDAAVEKNLGDMLKDADVLARELRASSPQRDGVSWFDWLPWVFAGLTGVGIVSLAVRRRQAR